MYNGVNIYMYILSPKQCTMVYIYTGADPGGGGGGGGRTP